MGCNPMQRSAQTLRKEVVARGFFGGVVAMESEIFKINKYQNSTPQNGKSRNATHIHTCSVRAPAQVNWPTNTLPCLDFTETKQNSNQTSRSSTTHVLVV